MNVDQSGDIWKQATLPVSSGDLSIRLTVDLALMPAFLSSVNGASELTLRLIPNRLHAVSGNCDPVYMAASLEWQTRCGAAVPDPVTASVQKAWDAPGVSRKYEEVLPSAHITKPGVPDLLRLLLLIPATSCTRFHARRSERGSMTPRCASQCHYVSVYSPGGYGAPFRLG